MLKNTIQALGSCCKGGERKLGRPRSLEGKKKFVRSSIDEEKKSLHQGGR